METDSKRGSDLTAEQMQAARIARREYMRDYMRRRYSEHPEKQHAAQMRYWARRAERTRAAEGD